MSDPKPNSGTEPKMYIGNEGRAEEQSELQRALDEREPAQEKAKTIYETMREYTSLLDTLPGYVQDLSKEMEEMRAAGIPDRAAYEKARDGLTRAYDQFRDVSRRMAFLVEDPKKGGTGSRRMAQLIKDGLIKENNQLEDNYIAAIEADAKWHAAQEMDQYGRREKDHTPYEERKTPLELYNEEVRKLLADANELEELGEFYEKNGTLEKNRPLIRAAMMGILEKLKELDAASDAQEQSRERESLIDLLAKLDERYPSVSAQPAAIASPVAQVRATHRQVKAQYVAVQHMLTDVQRREMRTRIAQLAGLVQEAEDDAWRQTFAPPPPPEPPAPKPDIAPMVQLAMSRAAAAAPAITSVVLPLPAKKGLFAVLGDAFKLK